MAITDRCVTSSLVLPVTEDQVSAFGEWVKNTYGTYNGYLGAFKAPAIDTYIRINILPQEMKSLLREAEPYIGVKNGDIHIKRIQINRKKILAKITHMKGKLGNMAFPVEARQIRTDKLAEALRQRQAREAIRLRQEQHFAEYEEAIRLGLYLFPAIIPVTKSPAIVQKQLSKEEAETCYMDDDCVICLAHHKMTDACDINCGHQFGRICLSKWKKDTCPLCRTTIKEITEFIVEDSSIIVDEQDQPLIAM
jgi:hypothetical protein